MEFTYVGGIDFDNTPLPENVIVFGIDFTKDLPVDVLPQQFQPDFAYDHAVAKLQRNQYFTHAD